MRRHTVPLDANFSVLPEYRGKLDDMLAQLDAHGRVDLAVADRSFETWI